MLVDEEFGASESNGVVHCLSDISCVQSRGNHTERVRAAEWSRKRTCLGSPTPDCRSGPESGACPQTRAPPSVADQVGRPRGISDIQVAPFTRQEDASWAPAGQYLIVSAQPSWQRTSVFFFFFSFLALLIMSTNTRQVALVIGASRGIGRQIAIDLARNGYAGEQRRRARPLD